MSSRIEWSGGWAELTERLTHARRMRIVRALRKATSDDPAENMEFGVVVLAAHIEHWSEGDVDPVTGPPTEALDHLPQDAVDLLAEAALQRWMTRADPNATGTPSSDGPSKGASAPTTPTSPTPSSS